MADAAAAAAAGAGGGGGGAEGTTPDGSMTIPRLPSACHDYSFAIKATRSLGEEAAIQASKFLRGTEGFFLPLESNESTEQRWWWQAFRISDDLLPRSLITYDVKRREPIGSSRHSPPLGDLHSVARRHWMTCTLSLTATIR